MAEILKIDSNDNVCVALEDLQPGKIAYKDREISLIERIPQKHKFLLNDLKKGDHIKMYGVSVGIANEDMKAGSLITTQNISHFASKPTQRVTTDWSPLDVSKWKDKKFMGYHRKDGTVGTRNYWLFIPLVFCENRNLRVIEEALLKTLGYKKRDNKYEQYARELVFGQSEESESTAAQRPFKNIDGIKFLYHQGGCGGTRKDSEVLLKLLAGYVNNPNVAGATILSLGCQNAQISWFQEIMSTSYPDCDKPLIFIEQQQIKNEDKMIRLAIEDTLKELKKANQIERQPAPLSKLKIGLECGGSDGFSGISANPAVGHVSDLVSSLGGITILSEFPELNGVEQNLVNRCKDDATADKFLQLQHAYEAKAIASGSGFHANPSPGNIKDGLITDAIKSAGAAKKGGTSPVMDVLDYTEPATQPGLNLLCTPGNDVESTTGLAGSGANMILFTTGLGTPTGNPIAPTIKISSNTSLFDSMNDIIDIDAGGVITGAKTIEKVGEEILELIISIANGQPSKAMLLDQDDFIPWKRDTSL